MKRLATALVAVLALASFLTATGTAENQHKSTHSTKPPRTCLLPAFEGFSAKVWNPKRWRRGAPPKATVQAAHKRIGCAPTQSHRTAMKHTWKRDRKRYGRYRELRQIAPYPGYVGRGLAERWLAIPRYIVDCESNGDWFAMNSSGASYLYQLLGWGAPYPDDWQAKMENHRIAAEVWAGGAGASNWVCA